MPTTEQRRLVENVARVLAEHWGYGYVFEQDDDSTNYTPDYWRDLARQALAPLDSFDGLVWAAQSLLDARYPADVFTGESGESGPGFVAKLREALACIPTEGGEES